MNSIQRLSSLRLRGLAGLLALGLFSSVSAAQAPAVTPQAGTGVTASAPMPPVPPRAAAPPPAVAAQAPPAPAAATAASPLNPAREEFPQTTPAPSSPELDALMSRVAALRSRIAALTATLFTSRLRIELRSLGDTARVKSLSVSLDGGVLYTAPAQAFFERAEVIYEHAVAPGPHVLAVEVERQDLREPQFSTWQLSRFVVVVPEKRLLWTRLELEDESSMGEDFAEDEAGEYELRVRLEAEVSE